MKTAKEDGEVAARHGQLEFVPLLAEVERQAFTGAIGPANAGFVQVAVVVRAKALEESHGEAANQRCPIGKFVPRPVIDTHRNVNVAINVERFGQALRKDVDNVVVAV